VALPFSKTHERSFQTATTLPSQGRKLMLINFPPDYFAQSARDWRMISPSSALVAESLPNWRVILPFDAP
jgi:hypothetical protein